MRTLKKVNTGEVSEKEKYDWRSIRNMFVEGFVDESGRMIYPSAKEISDMMFGPDDATAVRTIHKKSVEHKWVKLREAYKEELDAKRREMMVVAMAKKKVNFDMSCLNIAEAGLNEIIKHMKKSREAGELITPKDLERFAKTLAKFQISGRLSLGDTPKSIEDQLENNTINYDNLSKSELEALEDLVERSKSTRTEEG